MQHLIIGDIHGCFDELLDLLQAAGLAPDDQIIALGDIVDRGPDSPLAAYLHRMRQGRLSLEDLKQSFGGPAEAEACLKKSWINSY